MIALIIAPFYLLILFYICYRWFKFLNTIKDIEKIYIIILKLFILLTFVFSFFIPAGYLINNTELKLFFTKYGLLWLGISVYFILGILFALIIYKLLYKRIKNVIILKQFCILFIIIFTVIWSIGGYINAYNVRETDYSITLNKKNSDLNHLKIALIADLHLGFNIGEKHLEQVVDIINKNDVDLVIVAGDIFDNQYAMIDNPDRLIELFKSIDSKYGVYCVLGNHDVEDKLLCGFSFNLSEYKNASSEMLLFIQKANMQLLYDQEKIINDNLIIYGRPDYHTPNFNHLKGERKSVQDFIDDNSNDLPLIVIDHEPMDFDLLEEYGVDLCLSGHTHDGQIWPTKYLTDIVWDCDYGLYESNNFKAIVTSGVGLFGPALRTTTISEVAVIDINFVE